MHCFKKMKLVSLLVVLMMIMGLVPLVAPQAASAAPDFSSLNSLAPMYYWLAQNTAGLNKVDSDLAALKVFTPSAALEAQLFSPLASILPLPAAVITKYASAGAAEAAATQFLIDLEQIKYSTDAGTAIANAGTLYNNDATTEGNLLPGVTLVDFLAFATSVQTTGIESNLSLQQVATSGPLSSSLISSTLTSAMTSAADTAMTHAVVTTNGWSFANVAAAEMLIDQQVDPTYLGNSALFRAALSLAPISSSTPINLTPPAGSSGSLNLNLLTGGENSALPETTVSSPTDTVTISSGTTTTASGTGTWDGTISLPTVVTPPASELPAGAGSVVAISVGPSNPDVTLTFSSPVSILLYGQSGKSVGFIKGTTFTPITNKLTANTASALISSGQSDGYYDDGTNITIWTTHFTTFVSYTVAAPANGGASNYVPVYTTPTPTPVPTPAPVPAPVPARGPSSPTFPAPTGRTPILET